LLKAITLNEIERIFTVTDAMGISREALVIPLRTENPGHVKRLANGKLEIVVARDTDFDEWLTHLQREIHSATNPPARD
jgi:hypothetical protein